MSKAVALYIRVSTVDKQIKGLQSQEEALKEYCRNHNLTKIRIYKDKMSGSKIVRPQLNRLQQDIFLGKISTVICWKIDRLSRSLKDGINLLVDWLDRDKPPLKPVVAEHSGSSGLWDDSLMEIFSQFLLDKRN